MGNFPEGFATGELLIDVREKDASTLACIWQGRSTDRDPGAALNPYFETLLEAARERDASLEMRFESLEHFNSSTIASLIRFIQTARSRAVPLTLVYDASLKWQRLSFEALRVLDKNDRLLELVSV